MRPIPSVQEVSTPAALDLILRGVKPKQLTAVLFFVGTILLALPWLTPCTLGIGTSASAMVARLSHDDPLGYLPNDHLKKLAAKPGPHLTTAVQKSASLPISDSELTAAGAKLMGRKSNAMGGVTDGLAAALAASDGLTSIALGSGAPPDSYRDLRRQLVLCESPYVVLMANEIQFVPADAVGGIPKLARASGAARVMVVTSEGSFFGLASQIHFRGPSTEVILAGNPTVQSGYQFIKGRDPRTSFRLDFARRSVTSSGPFHDKKL